MVTAYPNLKWLVTPFKDNGRLSNEQLDFNYRISGSRVVVEHALGLLKSRFRRLRKLDNLDKVTCSEIIMGACILHNICLKEQDFIEADPNDFNEPDQVPYVNNPGVECNQQLNKQQLFDLLYN